MKEARRLVSFLGGGVSIFPFRKKFKSQVGGNTGERSFSNFIRESYETVKIIKSCTRNLDRTRMSQRKKIMSHGMGGNMQLASSDASNVRDGCTLKALLYKGGVKGSSSRQLPPFTDSLLTSQTPPQCVSLSSVDIFLLSAFLNLLTACPHLSRPLGTQLSTIVHFYAIRIACAS